MGFARWPNGEVTVPLTGQAKVPAAPAAAVAVAVCNVWFNTPANEPGTSICAGGAAAGASNVPAICAIRSERAARSDWISTVFQYRQGRSKSERNRGRMILETFAVGPLGCNCTILADEQSNEAIVIDGGDGVDEVTRRLAARGLRAKYLLHTHAHIDHIGNLGALRERTGAPGLLHPHDLPLYEALEWQAKLIGLSAPPPIVRVDADLNDGDEIRVGATGLRVLHTPGHTPGSVCFALTGDETQTILSGDTLFAGSIGRWDLGGTSMEDIVHSIKTKLFDYADDAVVVPGHGPSTTIGQERNANPYLQ